MLGLLCAGMSTAICVALASRLALPVSSSHAIVAGIGGFSLVHTSKGIKWWPGLGSVMASWVISPVLAGIVAGFFFFLTRWLVLSQPYEIASRRQAYLLSFVIGFVVFLVTVFVCYQKNVYATNPDLWNWLGVVLALILGAVTILVSHFLVVPALFRLFARANEFVPITEENPVPRTSN